MKTEMTDAEGQRAAAEERPWMSDAYRRKQAVASLEVRLRGAPDPTARRILASTLAAVRRGADLELAREARRRAWDCYHNEDEPDRVIEQLESDLAAATPSVR